MCGIAGQLRKNSPLKSDHLLLSTKAMCESIAYRGPDSSDVYVEPNLGLSLGHVRLSIQDLSPMGSQPMTSSNQRYTIIFNGEIYNVNELRNHINSKYCFSDWRGHSDTEVFLELIRFSGLNNALSLVEGMFAFALYDRSLNTLSLCVDRFGEKPLYLFSSNSSILFASDLNAFKSIADFPRTISRSALSLFFKYNYIPAPHCIYENCTKLRPGQCISIDLNYLTQSSFFYWDALAEIKNSYSIKYSNTLDFISCKSDLDSLISRSVSNQLISDVGVGTFLSGGIDSSLVTCFAQELLPSRLSTYTIGFSDIEFDEAQYARKIAKYLDTEHHELYVSDNDLLEVIPKLSNIYAEPFSDSSQIPTFLVAQLASCHNKVILSGDGADEIFGGYSRYIATQRTWSLVNRVPYFARRLLKVLTDVPPVIVYDYIFRLLNLLLSKRITSARFSKLINCFCSKDLFSLYSNFVTHWDNPTDLVIDSRELVSPIDEFQNSSGYFYDDISKMMAMDTVSYLPGDILVKVDRASMYNSLEVRCPFLNTDILRFAWSLPLSYKINGSKGKYILQSLLSDKLPSNLFDRPKMGFGVPIDRWIRGPLRPMVLELLSPSQLSTDGFLDQATVTRVINEHLDGKKSWGYYIWDILMFKLWYDSNS